MSQQSSLAQRAQAPARDLDGAYQLCDPFKPLVPGEDDALRQGLDEVRGEDRLASIQRNIRRARGLPTLHFLSGHTGCGKTTELLRLRQNILTDPRLGSDTHVLVVDADVLLNRQDIDLEDILVALWQVVLAEAPATAARVLAPIWKEQIAGSLKGVIANLPTALPDAIGKVLGEFKVPAVDQRARVRSALGNVSTVLIEGLNTAFEQLRAADSELAGSASVVVLIDNLEKLSEAQAGAVERLYLERLGSLKELDAHLVITVPLYLCYAAGGASLTARYGGEVVVLPMIKVKERIVDGGEAYPAGVAAMADLLARRIHLETLLEGGRGTAERIARDSGGCIRDALRILAQAISRHEDPPVSVASVERACAAVRLEFERALPEAWIADLVHVLETNRFGQECTVEVKQGLLRHRFVLEYQNGEVPVWYGVHPLVASCTKVRAALAESAPEADG